MDTPRAISPEPVKRGAAPALFVLASLGAALTVGCVQGSEGNAPRLPTVTATAVDWNDADTLLARVASTLDSGFTSADREGVVKLALAMELKDLEIPPPLEQGFPVVYRGRRTELLVRSRFADIGFHEYDFVSSDTALVAEIQSAVRSANLASMTTIDSALILSVDSWLRPDWRGDEGISPGPQLRVTTQQPLGCSQIDAEVARENALLRVTVLGAKRFTAICMDGSDWGPLIINLDTLPQDYQLKVVHRGIEDSYTLTVSDSLLSLEPAGGKVSRVAMPRRWRPPKQTLVYRCGLVDRTGLSSPNPPGVCDAFAKVLRDELEMTEISFRAGANPYGDNPSARYFRYGRPKDFRRAYDRLQSFSRSQLPRDNRAPTLSLENWRGARLSSYLCQPHQEWCRRGPEWW